MSAWMTVSAFWSLSVPQINVITSYSIHYTKLYDERSRCCHLTYSSCQTVLSRLMVEADRPGASLPNSAARASVKSPVEIPFRYSHGRKVSILLVFLKYGGKMDEVNLTLSLSESGCRSRIRGALTVICRITSYNVCYTKLLRDCFAATARHFELPK